MNIRDIKLSQDSVCGSGSVILVAKEPYFTYVDGKRSESQEGMKYVVVCPRKQLQTVAVKIPGADQLPNISQDELDVGTSSLTFRFITFEGFAGRLYTMNGSNGVSCTATSVKVVDNDADGDALNIEFESK